MMSGCEVCVLIFVSYPPGYNCQDFVYDNIFSYVKEAQRVVAVSVIIAGLLPIFYTEGFGSDVMRRIALPMVDGMVTTTLLTLVVIPMVYYIYEGRKLLKYLP